MKLKKILHRAQRPGLILVVTAAALYAFSGAGPATAGQLIYTPVNPSFGGNPLNGSYLLQKSQNGKRYPVPLDDLNLPNMDGIVAQTDSTIVFKQGENFYAYDINTHTTTRINFSNSSSSLPSSIAPASSVPSAPIDQGTLQ